MNNFAKLNKNHSGSDGRKQTCHPEAALSNHFRPGNIEYTINADFL